LIKKKIDIETLELSPTRSPRDPERGSPRPERSSRYAEETSRSAPRSNYSAPRRPSATHDPFFDRPYEPSNSSSEAPWENKTPSHALQRGLSPNIKPKKKIAALFGAKMAASE
jgi:ATP-dependent RNA helicase RhlE